MADPLIFVRGVHFAATLVACGTVGFIHLVVEPAKVPSDVQPLRDRLTALTLLALVVAILSGAVWLLLLAADILGTPFLDVCLHGGAWPVLFETRFGLVWCARFGLALALALSLFRAVPKGFQLGTAVLLLCLPALVGHAGATPGLTGDIHLASDMLHLLTAGAWLGSLPAYALLLWQARRNAKPAWDSFATRATQRFSTVAILSVSVLLATGLVNSWNLLSSPRDLLTTDYGRLIALKAGLFAVHARHRRGEQVLPHAAAAGTRVQCAACNATALPKFFLGICVLGFVGMLGTLSPTAHTHATSADQPPDVAFVHIHAPEAMAELTISPGRAGPVQTTIRVMREDFTMFPGKGGAPSPRTPDPGPPGTRTGCRRPGGRALAGQRNYHS